MNNKQTPYALSIAGYDPSGGAGVLADAKTFESFGIMGLAVATAVTCQNENEFHRCDWLETAHILAQINSLASCYSFTYVKIGLIRDLDTLETIIHHIHRINPEVKIIWDPILRASAGFRFHEKLNREKLEAILKSIFLLTPNIPEAIALAGSLEKARKELSRSCHLLIKGGHGDTDLSSDLLLYKDAAGKSPLQLDSVRLPGAGKHGSGCVFSSAITASLAKGFTLEASLLKAKQYISDYIQSSPARLGFHYKHTQDESGISRLHYITGEHPLLSHAQLAEQACRGGVGWIQLRMKNSSYAEWLAEAQEVKAVCDHYGARLIINDNVSIALETGAAGVHLGSEDMRPSEARRMLGKGFIIGGTANTAEDIERLQQEGVDYIGLGPFRFTGTKKKLSPVLGLEGIKNIIASKNRAIPIIGIGGILPEDIDALHSTGIDGIAVSSAISHTPDITAASFSFGQAVHKIFGSLAVHSFHERGQTKQAVPAAINEQ